MRNTNRIVKVYDSRDTENLILYYVEVTRLNKIVSIKDTKGNFKHIYRFNNNYGIYERVRSLRIETLQKYFKNSESFVYKVE